VGVSVEMPPDYRESYYYPCNPLSVVYGLPELGSKNHNKLRTGQ
jgi:hypothetical protein